MTFPDFIESLRRNGVASIGLEFHPPTTVVEDTLVVGKSIELAGVKFVRVEFFAPQIPKGLEDESKPTPPLPPFQPTPEPERHDEELNRAAEAVCVELGLRKPVAEAAKIVTPLQPDGFAKPQEPEQKAEPVMPTEPAEAAAAKPKRERKERKPAAETEVRAPEQPAAAMAKPGKVYDVFVETVEQDDGTKADVKRGLIAQMTLDDMLRVNATFCLGLDTDVATEALRAELTTCFI